MAGPSVNLLRRLLVGRRRHRGLVERAAVVDALVGLVALLARRPTPTGVGFFSGLTIESLTSSLGALGRRLDHHGRRPATSSARSTKSASGSSM